jgi:hypothetical protein
MMNYLIDRLNAAAQKKGLKNHKELAAYLGVHASEISKCIGPRVQAKIKRWIEFVEKAHDL